MINFFANSLPKPKSDYLASLSTPFGIMQHASFDLADPHFGYAADDNARALIVANFWRHEEKKYLFQEFEERYLKFLKFLQTKDGRFYCYLTFDLKKRELGTGDWFGRTLFALSYLMANSERFDRPALSIVRRSLPRVLDRPADFPDLRTRAYLLLAFHYLYQEQEKKGSVFARGEVGRLREIIKDWGEDFLAQLEKNSGKEWVWPEKVITYDNGKVIQAYFLLGLLCQQKRYLRAGEKMLRFYLDNTLTGGYFQAPGNANGFWRRGRKMPLVDEQPLEASSLVTALTTAALVLEKKEYLEKAKLVYEWFFGKNRLGLSLVDKKSGAVHDGLEKNNLNSNKGAESYLALNLAYFALKKRVHL